MTEPVCLVEPLPYSNGLWVNPEALSFLRSLPGPLHVVAIFGPQATGKSFLMDQLAGQVKGFPCSPGIWLRSVPHPTQPGAILLLLDTAGVPEHLQEDEMFFKLFVLDVLLCSVFIYNTKGDGDLQEELDRLIYVTELPNKVRVMEDCPSENSFLLNSVLPEFVWCIRNVAPDMFWEVLQVTDNNMDVLLSSPEALEGTPTSCIQKLFPSRKAFCFCSPHLDADDLASDVPHSFFQEQLRPLKDHILSRGPKCSLGNTFVTGAVLSDLLEHFMDALSQDQPIFLNEISHAQGAALTWEGDVDVMDSLAQPPQTVPERKETPRNSQPPMQESKVPCFPPSPSWVAPTMAACGSMEEPMCLIENHPGDKLQVNQVALRILQSIQQPTVVVAIVGLYRTGKSYLMNKLAGKTKGGFSLGATVQANTKGIWMWCCPHPLKPDHTLVLLDTEGLGDVEKSNTENDAWIFALSILLSSTFVYNSLGSIDNYALEKLHYVTELTERIKVKASAQPSSDDNEVPNDFVWFFPTFIWAVRDFSLVLELDGNVASEDEYLENSLRRRKGVCEKLDLAKKYLREYFPSRKCFVFDRPAANRKELANLENMPDCELNPEFLKQTQSFCQYIYSNAQAKVIHRGHAVTGTVLGSLAVTYVEAIRNGAMPCIENAVLALAQTENEAAVRDALKRYGEMMELLLELPTESVAEFLVAHAECEKEAIQVFLARSFKDEDQEFQKRLGNEMHHKLEEFDRLNKQASSDRCTAVLMELFQELEKKIQHGRYSVPGGYQQFQDDQGKTVEQYNLVEQKGIMASEVLQDYLKSKETAALSILQADRKLKEEQKKFEAERARAEACEREAELQRQKREEIQRQAQDKERSYELHKKQLEDKLYYDRIKLQADQERVLAQKLQEQSHLQQAGLQKEVSRLNSEIQSLHHQISENKRKKSSCLIS